MDSAPVKFRASDAARVADDAARSTFYQFMKLADAARARIRRTVHEDPTTTWLVYTIPKILPGGALPRGGMPSAVNHVIHALREDGYIAEYLGDAHIFVSWVHAARSAYRVPQVVNAVDS